MLVSHTWTIGLCRLATVPPTTFITFCILASVLKRFWIIQIMLKKCRMKMQVESSLVAMSVSLWVLNRLNWSQTKVTKNTAGNPKNSRISIFATLRWRYKTLLFTKEAIIRLLTCLLWIKAQNKIYGNYSFILKTLHNTILTESEYGVQWKSSSNVKFGYSIKANVYSG